MSENTGPAKAIVDLLEEYTDFSIPDDASVLSYDTELDDSQYFESNSRGLVVTTTIISMSGVADAEFRFRVDRTDFNDAMEGHRL